MACAVIAAPPGRRNRSFRWRRLRLSRARHPSSWPARSRSRDDSFSTRGACSAPIPANRPPRSTTTTTPRCLSSPQRSPREPLATSASDSPTLASPGDHSTLREGPAPVIHESDTRGSGNGVQRRHAVNRHEPRSPAGRVADRQQHRTQVRRGRRNQSVGHGTTVAYGCTARTGATPDRTLVTRWRFRPICAGGVGRARAGFRHQGGARDRPAAPAPGCSRSQ